MHAIRRIISAVAPEARVILYGSRARGDEKSDSDWDLLVLLDKPRIEPQDHENISWPLCKMGWELGEHISVKLYTYRDWKKRSFTPFYKAVSREGVVL